jgi:hypothetical protein
MSRLLRTLSFVALAILASSGTRAQQPTVELKESFLNRVLGGMGAMSEAGVAQPFNIARAPTYELCVPMGRIACPSLSSPLPGFGSNEIPLVACKKYGGGYSVMPVGDPVPWQWWVSNARLTLGSNSLQFTATVSTRVGGEWHQETRTVGASIKYDTASSSLKLSIDPFSVPLVLRNPSVNLDEPPVDVAKLFGIALSLQTQALVVPLPNGISRTFNGRVTGATATYLPGIARITLNVAL